MNTVELIHYSLGFAFEILDGLVSDLTQEQADWTPPGLANPIGALYWHIICHVDWVAHTWGMEEPPLSESAGWKERVVISRPPVDEGDPLGELRAVRVGLQVDLPALHDYAHATAQVLKEWTASLTPEDLDRIIDTTIGPLTLGQTIEAFITWHINVHCGEISALKGCQGLTGYPW